MTTIKDPFPEFEPKTTGEAIAKGAVLIAHALAEHQKAREKYLASLSPQQREALSKREAEEKIEQEFKNFRSNLGSFATSLARRESWTIPDFASLLAGLKPGQSNVLYKTRAEELRDEIQATLQSCIGASLHPLSGNMQSIKALYRTHELLAVAGAKALGQHQFVARLAGTMPQLPATSKPVAVARPLLPPPPIKTPAALVTLATQGLAARRDTVSERRKNQIEMARILVAEGFGTEKDQAIGLSVRSASFNARLRKRFPQYADVDDRTLREDRSQCRPAIVLPVGRPRNSAMKRDLPRTTRRS